MENSTLIIAEAGVNHNGDLSMAFRLVHAAAASGADVIKFQTFSAERLVTRQAKKAEYQQRATAGIKSAGDSQLEMLRALELTDEMHREIQQCCIESGISFLSTAFDLESLDYIASLKLPLIKVPSGEITNVPYLRQVGRLKRTVLLSTGMATIGEIEAAVALIEESGTERSSITALHCNTEYPTPMHDVNLRAMHSIGTALGLKVGYSDHTLGIEVPVAAVALGAVVIEKHLTLDRNLQGPDHNASLEPDQFSEMVKSIRRVEVALGDGIKRPTRSELKNRAAARKSIVALRLIKAGEYFTQDNITTKRPESGISSSYWDLVIGRRANRNFDPDEPITLGLE